MKIGPKLMMVLAAVGLVVVFAVVAAVAKVGIFAKDDSQPSPAVSSSSAASPSPSPSDRQLADGKCMTPELANRQDSEDTALTFAAVAMCWDAAEDQTPVEGVLRARELMSPELVKQYEAAQLRNPYQAQWNQAWEHEAFSVPEVVRTPGDHSEPLEGGLVQHGVSVSWQWTGRDGHQIPGGSTQLMIRLKKNPAGQWEVTSYRPTTVSIED